MEPKTTFGDEREGVGIHNLPTLGVVPQADAVDTTKTSFASPPPEVLPIVPPTPRALTKREEHIKRVYARERPEGEPEPRPSFSKQLIRLQHKMMLALGLKRK